MNRRLRLRYRPEISQLQLHPYRSYGKIHTPSTLTTVFSWTKTLPNFISKKINWRWFIKYLRALPFLFRALVYTAWYRLWWYSAPKKWVYARCWAHQFEASFSFSRKNLWY